MQTSTTLRNRLAVGLRSAVNRSANRFGYNITNIGVLHADMLSDERFVEIRRLVAPSTMTGIEAQYALYQLVNYAIDTGIAGDFVECGVWRGGSCLLIAEVLAERKATADIHLFDLFDMPDSQGRKYWKAVPQDEVRQTLAQSKYPAGRFVFHPGDLAETMRVTASLPERIAVLRLDSDYYDPTRAALEALVPLVVEGGAVIIDDYGAHPDDAGRAADEFLAKRSMPVFLHRLDNGSRMWMVGS